MHIKFTVCMTFMFLLSYGVKAQFFNAGLFGGIGFSEIFLNYEYIEMRPGKNKVGYLFGAFVNHKLNKRWVNQLELNLTTKGHKSTYYSNKVLVSQWGIAQSYVGPAFLLKYNVWKKLFVGTGVSINDLNCTKSLENYGAVPLSLLNLSFTRFDKCWIFDLSWGLSGALEISFRASNSIFSTTKQGKTAFWQVVNYKNRGTFNETAGFNLAYTFKK